MKKYIDAEEFKRILIDDKSFYPAIVKNVLENMPAADVKEVVRCKDCDVPHNKWTGCPKLGGLVTPPDFYCAFGESKL